MLVVGISLPALRSRRLAIPIAATLLPLRRSFAQRPISRLHFSAGIWRFLQA